MKYIVNLLQGALMGIVEILPGVSGSTMALVMGIYDDFINLLYGAGVTFRAGVRAVFRVGTFRTVRERFGEIDLRFGIFLGIGMLLTVAIFSGVITDLLDRYPQYMNAFFFGLVLLSIKIPWGEMKLRTTNQYFLIILSFVITFVLLGLDSASVNDNPGLLLLFAGGVLGVSGMILPGVSGSFILLILGLYDFALELIHDAFRLNLDSEQLLKFGAFVLGQVVGFLVFVRVLKISLKYYRSEVMAILIGVMIGSLRVLWPFFIMLGDGEHGVKDYVQPWSVDIGEFALIVVLALVGGGLVFVLNRLGGDREQLGDI